jgi:hypothetical protein
METDEATVLAYHIKALNDPNMDVDGLLERNSNERLRNSSPANHPSSSIRRRTNAAPPASLSPPPSATTSTPQSTPSGTFPLISSIHQFHQFPPQQSYLLPPNADQNPQLFPSPAPGGSQAHSSSHSVPAIPRIYINSSKGHDTDEYDLESIAQSSSSRRISRDSYGYEKKGVMRDYDDMEMDTRSDLDFEELVICLYPLAC